MCVYEYTCQSVGAWVYMHANMTFFWDITPRGVAGEGGLGKWCDHPGNRVKGKENWISK
jgi:hypothetical protein